MKSNLRPGKTLSMLIGVCFVALLDSSTPLTLSGPGMNGMLKAGFWYGLVGVGGGLCVYKIIQRIKGSH